LVGVFDGDFVVGLLDGDTIGATVGERVVLKSGCSRSSVGEPDGGLVSVLIGDWVCIIVGALLRETVGDSVVPCHVEGETDGVSVGVFDGDWVGVVVGPSVGEIVGVTVGCRVAPSEGESDGVSVGVFDGDWVGVVVGPSEGETVGVAVRGVGEIDGVSVGVPVGDWVGVVVGPSEGDIVGSDVFDCACGGESAESLLFTRFPVSKILIVDISISIFIEVIFVADQSKL